MGFMERYLVSVFVGGKCVESHYWENLDDLVTLNALHKNCEISVFDLSTLQRLSKEQVKNEIRRSGHRWKKQFEKTHNHEKKKKEIIKKSKRVKPKKYWARPVMCVETGIVYCSIWDCCERLGLSHKAVWNAINSGQARNGFHFINAPIFQNMFLCKIKNECKRVLRQGESVAEGTENLLESQM